MPSIANLFVELKLQAESFNSGLKNAQREAREFEKVIKPTTELLKDVGKAATTAGIALTASLTAPIVAIGGVGIAFNAMQEQATVAFTTMLGDGGKARVFLEDLKSFAAQTPFEFPDLVRAAQRLMAMGFAADDVKPLLSAVGDAVAGLGGGAAEIDRVTLALGQMSGRGKIATGEMNQLTEVGIPAWKMLADGIGVSEGKIRDLVEKGMVPAGRGIDILVAGMSEKFGGMMGQQAQTFNGLVSTIKDESRFLAGELTTGLFQALKGPAETVVGFLHQLREAMGGWSAETKTAVAGLGILLAAIGPVLIVLGTMATSVSSLIGVTSKLILLLTGSTSVSAGLGVMGTKLSALAMSGGPILLTVAAVAALGLAIWKWRDAMNDAHEAEDNLLRSLSEQASSTEKAADALRDNYGIEIKKGTMSTSEWGEALGQAANTAAWFKEKNAELARSHDDTGVAVAAHTLLTKEQIEAQKHFNDAVGALKESVTGNKGDLQVLERALKDLTTAGIPTEDIVKKLGSAAQDAAGKWKTMGADIPVATAAIAQAAVLGPARERALAELNATLGGANDIWNAKLTAASDQFANSLAGKSAILSQQISGQWQATEATIGASHNASVGILTQPITVPKVEISTQLNIAKLAEDKKRLTDAVSDMKSAAGEIFDAMFLKGENVFSTLANLLKGGALSLGRAIFQDVTAELLGPIKAAFDSFFEGLLESTGIKKFLSELGAKIGGVLSDVFGGSGAVGSVVSGGGSVVGGTAGGAGSIGGAAAGGVTSILSGVISGSIAAVGSIIGGLMGEGNAKRTEENTRETRDWLEIMAVAWNPLFHQIDYNVTNKMIPLLNEIKDILWEVRADAVPNGLAAVVDALGAMGSRSNATVLQPNTIGHAAGPGITVNAVFASSDGRQAARDFVDELVLDGTLRKRLAEAMG